jgi:ABC-2 type transport system ATP-binding protein
MLELLQRAGNINEMTLESENIDHLIAAMYKEMDL